MPGNSRTSCPDATTARSSSSAIIPSTRSGPAPKDSSAALSHNLVLIMPTLTEFDLAEATALLSRTPASLNALLRGLPEQWVRGNEGRDTWSPFDIMGHLVVAERTDWMVRVQMILEHGDSKPFHPFDRSAQLRENRDKSLESLLDDFARLRSENLATLQTLNLQPEDFARRGMHPALGPVTLLQLLATWAVHDLTHLHQLSRVMAHQYRDAVGPWSAYLGVLQCNGHSAPR